MSNKSNDKLNNWADRVFRVGVLLTAALLPLDRLSVRLASLLSILSLVLLLVRPAVMLVAGLRHRRLTRALPLTRSMLITFALALPVVAGYASIRGALVPSLASSTAHILFVLAARAWLLAIFATKEDIVWFCTSTLVVGAIVVGLGWLQGIADLMGFPSNVTFLKAMYSSRSTYVLPRPQSTALEPLYLANYLFLVMGALLARLWCPLRARERASLYALLVATLGLVLATASRGAEVGLIAILVAYGIMMLWQQPRLRKMAIIVLVVCVIGAIGTVGYVYAQYKNHPVVQTIGVKRTLAQDIEHYLNFNDRSANTRYELWPEAISAWQSHPVFGVGLFNSRIYIHRGAYSQGEALSALQPLNNDYLTWLAETGTAGVLLVLPLIGSLVWCLVLAIRNPKTLLTPFAIALTGMAIQATTFDSWLLLRAWVVIGMTLAAYRLYDPARSAK